MLSECAWYCMDTYVIKIRIKQNINNEMIIPIYQVYNATLIPILQ